MSNEFKVRKGLIIQGSGSVGDNLLLDVQGNQGQLFSISDSLSGSLFSVGDISGVPILEVFSDEIVKIGTFNSEGLIVNGSNVTSSGNISASGDIISNDIFIDDNIYHNGNTNTRLNFEGDNLYRVIINGSEKILYSTSNTRFSNNDILLNSVDISGSGNSNITVATGSFSKDVIIKDTGTTRGVRRDNAGFNLQLLGGTTTSDGAFISLGGEGRGIIGNVLAGKVEITQGGTGYANRASISSSMVFNAKSSAGSSTDMAIVGSTGNVGIATTSPGAKLHISGTTTTEDLFKVENDVGTDIAVFSSSGQFVLGPSGGTPADSSDPVAIFYSRDASDPGKLEFNKNANGGGETSIKFGGSGRIQGRAGKFFVNSANRDMGFTVSSDSNTSINSTAMYISKSGNIFANADVSTSGDFIINNNKGFISKNVAGSERTLITLDNSNVLKIKGNDSEGSSNVITMVAGGDVTMPADLTVTNDLTVGGRITAEEFHTEFVSASVIFKSGSTAFGDTLDDIHSITGSLKVTGSINVPDNTKINIGDSNDLQIYHDGSNSYIEDAGTGVLAIASSQTNFQVGGANKMIVGTDDITIIDGINLDVGNHITASGNISASGTITANSFVGSFTGGVTGDATGLTGTPTITVDNINVSGDIIHNGDPDTKISLTGDDINIKVGNVNMLDFTENPSSQDEITFNEGGADLDVRMEGDSDQNLFFLDAGNDKVGIGTNSPGQKLSIVGDISASGTGSFGGDVTIRSGSFHVETFNEGIRFFNGTNYTANKIQLSTAQNMQFSAGGVAQFNPTVEILAGAQIRFKNANNTDRIQIHNGGGSGAGNSRLDFEDSSNNIKMSISSSGKVGIGTNTPHLPLHVEGDARIEGNFIVGNCASTNNPAADIHIKSSNTDAKLRIEDLDDDNLAYDFLVNSGSGLTITETTDTTSRIHIEQGTGNIGIGTASPAEKLEVDGSVKIGNMKLQNSGGGRIGLNRNTANGSIYNSSISAYQIQNNTGDFEIQSYTGAGGFLGSVFIVSGSIGIATNSPDELLHVSGTNDTRIQIQNSSTSHKAGLVLRSFRSSGTHGNSEFYKKDFTTYIDVDEDFLIRPNNASALGVSSIGDISFISSSGADTSITNYFRADASTRRIGIGTTSPAEKLTVEGNISSSGAINTLSHITASGNISSSGGQVKAQKFEFDYQQDGVIGVNSIGNDIVFLRVDDGQFGIVNGISNIARGLQTGNTNGWQIGNTNAGISGRQATGVSTVAINSAGNQVLTITGSKAGIGNARPTEALTVEGNISASGNSIVNQITASGNVIFSGHLDAETITVTDTIQADALVGTIGTAAQTSITTLGTLTGLTINGNLLLENNKEIRQKDTGGTQRTILELDNSNDLNLGGSFAGSLKIIGGGSYSEIARFDDNGHFSQSNGKNLTTTQITASGNISASGKVITEEIEGNSITLDSAGDITLDAAGNDVLFRDSGTHIGTINMSNSNLNILSSVNNKDIIFKGKDDSSDITALTLDMSDAGRAIFNNHITASGNISSSGRVYGTHFGTGNANRNAIDFGTNNTLQFRINDGSRITFTQTQFRPTSDEGVRLGTFNNKFSELVVKHVTASGNIIVTGSNNIFIGSGSGIISASTVETESIHILGGNLSVGPATPGGFLGIGESSNGGKLRFGNHASDNNSIIFGASQFQIKTTQPHGIQFYTQGPTRRGGILNSGELSMSGSIHGQSHITASGNIKAEGEIIGKAGLLEYVVTAAGVIEGKGDVVFFGSTTSMDPGQIYMYGQSGGTTWAKADANQVAKADGLLGVALGDSSNTDGVLLRGMVTLDHDPGTAGDPLFLSSASIGLASSTAPTGNGDVVRVIGYCVNSSNNQIFFNPDGTFIEVTA